MASSSSGSIKRIYLAATALLIVLAIYLINRDGAQLQADQELLPKLNSWPSMSADPALDPLVANANRELARAQQALASPVNSSRDLKPVQESAVNLADAWRTPTANTPTPSMPLPSGVSIFEPVAVDMENPAYPEAGQQIAVSMPGGERLQVNIENSSTNPNGDYTWRGHLEGYGDEYPVVMTYGGSSVFATVTTPKGSYTLESVNGSGWIYKNPSELELSSPGANDYLEIPLNL